MVVSKTNKSKKKDKSGPKGKKARAKAKLENRWGESNTNDTAGTDDKTGKKYTSRNRSRLLLTTDEKNDLSLKKKKKRQHHHQINEGRDGFYKRINEGHVEQEMEKLQRKVEFPSSRFLRRQQKQQQQKKKTEHGRRRNNGNSYNDDDDSVSSSSSATDDDNMHDDNDIDDDDDVNFGNKNSMNDLLSMIHSSCSKNKNKMISENDDSEEDEEGSISSNSNSSSSDGDDDDDDDDDDNHNKDSIMIVDAIKDDQDDSTRKNSNQKLDDINSRSSDSANSKIDFFRMRFSREPFSNSEVIEQQQQQEENQHQRRKRNQKNAIKKIPVPGDIELQFTSSPFADSIHQQKHDITALNGHNNNNDDDGICDDLLAFGVGVGSSNVGAAKTTCTTARTWQSIAMDTFNSDSTRDVLRSNWMIQVMLKEEEQKKKKETTKKKKTTQILSEMQAPVYSFLSRYTDTFVATTKNGGTGSEINYSGYKNDTKQQKEYHQLYLLHILNHVLTSRSRIGRNNRYLKSQEEEMSNEKKMKKEQQEKKKKKKDNDDDDDDERNNGNRDEFMKDANRDEHEQKDSRARCVRDQGYTRPTVLVLLPTRGTCHTFINNLYRMTGTGIENDQKKRFEDDYGPLPPEDDEGEDDNDPDKERRRKAVLLSKGKEWNEYFGDTANQDDDFKIGISIIPKAANSNISTSSSKDTTVATKKKNKEEQKQQQQKSNVSVKLYSDFYKSDIIVASPLGLKMLLTPDGSGGGDGDNDDDDDEAEDESNKGARSASSFDYLSSIEICLVQHSEMIMMQNWDHVNEILSLLNQQPKNNNSTDFSRVRNYLLDGQGQYWRQLIVSSKFMDPSLISSFKRYSKSISGQMKLRRKIRDDKASVSNVVLPTGMKQVFQKVPTGSFQQQSKARVDYVVKHLLPLIHRNDQSHTLIYVPSYFDYCSLRNTMLKQESFSNLFVSVTEYSRITEVGRGRARFLQGRKPIMLYTGRAHFFHRHSIKGIRNLIFLGLPEHPEFYSEYVNLITTTNNSSNHTNDHDNTDSMLVGHDDFSTYQNKDRSCTALFTKYEAHALERIVGSSNCNRMMSSQNTTYMFSS